MRVCRCDDVLLRVDSLYVPYVWVACGVVRACPGDVFVVCGLLSTWSRIDSKAREGTNNNIIIVCGRSKVHSCAGTGL